MQINLISDTVTKPTPAMLEAMFNAEVGDDVFGENPTINALEAKVSKMFGKESALFCPSGTMTNQIAIKCHTQPLDEIICHNLSHIKQAEGGSYAFHSGVSMTTLEGPQGKITADQIEPVIKSEFDWTARSTLVVIENTCNIDGGAIYKKKEIKPISDLCKKRSLKLHLDGARLFNALVESGDSPKDMGKLFDSVSLCLSKGLEAPVGSLLIVNQYFIKKSRRILKIMGGGMRQAGFLAATGIYALENNINRLKLDHHHARVIAGVLEQLPFVENIRPIETNILIFDVKPPMSRVNFIENLKKENILAVTFGPQRVRFVTHLDFTEDMLDKTVEVLKKMG
jgi:threonine aldolase